MNQFNQRLLKLHCELWRVELLHAVILQEIELIVPFCKQRVTKMSRIQYQRQKKRAV